MISHKDYKKRVQASGSGLILYFHIGDLSRSDGLGE